MPHRRFEELADVCDAHDLDLRLHGELVAGKRGSDFARYCLTIEVVDGADGQTLMSVGEAEALDVAAFEALRRLRRAGVVP